MLIPEEDIALLPVRMLRVGYYPSEVIKESRLRFVERNAVLLLIFRVDQISPREASVVIANEGGLSGFG